MAQGGRILIDYSINPVNSSISYNSYLLFLVTTHNEQGGWYANMPAYSNTGKLLLDTSDIESICTSPSLYRKAITSSGSGSVSYTIYHTTSDLYFVSALQCVPSSDVPLNIPSSGNGTREITALLTTIEVNVQNLQTGSVSSSAVEVNTLTNTVLDPTNGFSNMTLKANDDVSNEQTASMGHYNHLSIQYVMLLVAYDYLSTIHVIILVFLILQILYGM